MCHDMAASFGREDEPEHPLVQVLMGICASAGQAKPGHGQRVQMLALIQGYRCGGLGQILSMCGSLSTVQLPFGSEMMSLLRSFCHQGLHMCSSVLVAQ